MNVTAIHPYGVFIEASIEVFHCNMTITARAIVGPFELKADADAWAKKYESACCVLNGPMPQEHMEAHCVRESLGAYVQGFCSSVEVKAIDRAWRSSDLLLPVEDPVVAAASCRRTSSSLLEGRLKRCKKNSRRRPRRVRCSDILDF